MNDHTADCCVVQQLKRKLHEALERNRELEQAFTQLKSERNFLRSKITEGERRARELAGLLHVEVHCDM